VLAVRAAQSGRSVEGEAGAVLRAGLPALAESAVRDLLDRAPDAVVPAGEPAGTTSTLTGDTATGILPPGGPELGPTGDARR